MKIAMCDENGLKFSRDLKEHWEKKGHEVRYETGASEFLAQWADLYYVEFWTNNIHYLYKLYHGQQEIAKGLKWDNNKKPKIAVRALDWEVWIGMMRDQSIIDWVDKIIFIAPHIQDRVRSEVDMKGKDKVIKPGVNLDRFTLKTKQTDGFQLGMVLGDMWKYKGHIAGLDIFTTLYRQDNRWRLHVRGQHENSMYDPIDWNYYLKSRGIEEVVTLSPHVEDMNQWYEDIDILLHPGRKEAFCYAVAEAMAKGIPAVVNDFYGSKDIWPGIYQTHEEAVEAILLAQPLLTENGRSFFRNYIQSTYSLEKQLKETDEYLGT